MSTTKPKQVWIRQMDAARQAQIAVVVEILGELDYLKPEAAEIDPVMVAECVIRNVDLDGVIRDMEESHEEALPEKKEGVYPTVERTPIEELPCCPRCGGEMTVRVVKNGPRAGSRFAGCLNYPACKGTASIES